jgi:hypothetical protein
MWVYNVHYYCLLVDSQYLSMSSLSKVSKLYIISHIEVTLPKVTYSYTQGCLDIGCGHVGRPRLPTMFAFVNSCPPSRPLGIRHPDCQTVRLRHLSVAIRPARLLLRASFFFIYFEILKFEILDPQAIFWRIICINWISISNSDLEGLQNC